VYKPSKTTIKRWHPPSNCSGGKIPHVQILVSMALDPTHISFLGKLLFLSPNISNGSNPKSYDFLSALVVRARTPAFSLIGIHMVSIGIRLQTWMRVIVGVDI